MGDQFASFATFGLESIVLPIMNVESMITFSKKLLVLALCSFHTATALAYVTTAGIRARDLGVPFEGTPGEFNAITDVHGVEVGQTTLIQGEGKLIVGQGPVRTGVTAILPLGRDNSNTPVPAAVFSYNGNGEMTGSEWVEESGFLEGPVLLTNTHSVGVVHDAVIEWGTRKFPGTGYFSLPVVGETWDGALNDINGFHVKKEHVFRALDSAKSGAVAEGNVGGGTGMRAFGFKAGTGTSSRVLPDESGFSVGVLVQANFGRRENLVIAGVPVGKEITDLQPVIHHPEGEGSLLVVIATNAPLLPHQLKRLAKRAALGMARTGAVSTDSSGDLFIAFSTATPTRVGDREQWSTLKNTDLDPLLAATVQATEEAIINALVAAKTMRGINDNTFYSLPHDRLREVLGKYNRLVGKDS
ncbi:MAG TPA: P1 family peptidase [Chthoniobacterales bacterium]|nr:P1 family peptidase [Chthoniobacterales bacterium]